MSAFVILAAGRGSRIGRVGDSLHKALVPLGQRAVISWLLDLAPNDARVIVAVGHRAAQIQEYVSLAHPRRRVEFVKVKGWDKPGGGPGHSLLACADAVGEDDMTFTSCDTLWTPDATLWTQAGSWAAVAHIPAGTEPERWCVMRIHEDDGTIGSIVDKQPVEDPRKYMAYTGLAHITQHDLPYFWEGVLSGTEVGGERQVTGGLQAVAPLHARQIAWTDVGTADAYADAVARVSGYDFVKLDEATYVLPQEGRVVKYWKNKETLEKRALRLSYLNGAVPALSGMGSSMLAYRYTPGVTGYQAADLSGDGSTMTDLLDWAITELWKDVDNPPQPYMQAAVCREFYEQKTLDRLMLLRPELRRRALDIVEDIDFGALAQGCVPGRIHGDFNLGNVLQSDHGWVGIDWREDFGGELDWGDIRYDVGKLLAGTVIHWERAQRGDFRRWDHEDVNRKAIMRNGWRGQGRDIQIIGALSLLNSAPLHAAPLDEVAVARGTQWLQEVL